MQSRDVTKVTCHHVKNAGVPVSWQSIEKRFETTKKKRPKNIRKLAWIIHEPRLPQMQGAAYEAVVLHRECAATRQMR
jgi:hypothetical protein